ncbi:MAG: hypothetical protein GC191_09505 [Azospirillum sp.]|nr:hypothetical protein [Azospirillum sp.]
MNELTKGEVVITLDGQEVTLKPSLGAFTVLSSRYETYGELLRLLAAGNVPAIIQVLRQGLGLTDAQAKRLPNQLFSTGVSDLIDPVSDYVFRLFNAGKSPAEVMAAQAEAAGSGAENPSRA